MIDLNSFEADILNQSVPLSSLLLKAKVLASQLQSEEFIDWVESELNGYDRADASLPTYRHIPCSSYGNFSGPFGTVIPNFPIPNSNLPEEMRPFASHLYLTEPVSAFEQDLSEQGKSMGVPWPGDWVKKVQVDILEGYALMQAWKPVTRAQMRSIIDSVRSRLLDSVIELRKVLPRDDAVPVFENVPAHEVSTFVQNVIYGGTAVISAGESIDQTLTQNIVQSADIEALLTHLREAGIPDEDIEELETAVKDDGDRRKEQGFGNRVKEWLAKAAQKIATDIWKLGTETIPVIVARYLASYYGWD